MKTKCMLNRVCDQCELGAFAAVQVPQGQAQFFQRGAAHWFKTGKFILALTSLLVASVWVSSDLRAAVIYTAGTETVGVGGVVTVPITVSSDLTPPSVNWLNAGFHLTWDSSVLSLQSTSPISVNVAGSPLPLVLGNFFSPIAGQLNFTWTDVDVGYPVPNGSTLFTVNFTAVGALGSSTSLGFTTVAPIGLDDSLGNNFTSVTPTFTVGNVTVVPEPVNWALGFFACVFVGGATVRWVSNRRVSLQPAQTVLYSEPRG